MSYSNLLHANARTHMPLSELETSDDEYSHSTTSLTKLKLFQGSIILFVGMALLNFLLGSCILAILSHTSNSKTRVTSEFDIYSSLLSTEVILPLSMLIHPPKYKPRRTKRSHASTKSTPLATTVISRVIDFMGPVLPFVGGIDFRKLNLFEWIKNYILCKDCGMSIAQSFNAGHNASTSFLSRLKNASRHELQSLSHHTPKTNALQQDYWTDKNRPLVLGSSESFLSTSDIAELNLEEVALAFQLSTNQVFDITSCRGQMHRLVDAIQEAAAVSRGRNVHPARLQDVNQQSSSGDHIDASLFCAALRIFAEWRMIRTVPKGYKSYSIGMALGLKDVVQNIAKVEVVLREWIERKSLSLASDGRNDSSDEIVLRGPTLRQLLEYERDNNLHPNLPRLRVGSAVGLLWSLRQLLYQSAVFQNILDTPDKYPDTKAAVGAAYSQVYNKYHGWAVQQIFNYSFKASPDISLIFNMMDTNKLREITDGANNGIINSCQEEGSIATRDTEISNANDSAAEVDAFLLDMAFWETGGTDVTQSPVFSQTIEHLEVDRDSSSNDWVGKLMHSTFTFVDRIDHEFSKVGAKLFFLTSWCRNFSGPKDRKKANKVIEIEENVTIQPTDCHKTIFSLEGSDLEMHITTEMEKHIRKQISNYLQLMKPITFELEEMFHELNMNDPSKV